MKSIITFLKETWQRLKAASPSYFQVIQWITGIVAFITGIPALLAQYNIILPAKLQALANGAVAIAAVIGFIVSKLPVKDPSVLKK